MEWASATHSELGVVGGEFCDAAIAGVGVVVVFPESNRPGSPSVACVECDSGTACDVYASGDIADRGVDVAGNAVPVHPGRRGCIEELLWVIANWMRLRLTASLLGFTACADATATASITSDAVARLIL